MIVEIALPAETDFDAWRDHARRLCAEGIAPENVVWTTPERGASLFAADPPASKPTGKVRAPRRFIDLARRVICHRDPERFARLYRILWRLQREPDLLTNAADADIAWLHERDKAIRRDIHKMHAFVRFRLVGEPTGARSMPPGSSRRTASSRWPRRSSCAGLRQWTGRSLRRMKACAGRTAN